MMLKIYTSNVKENAKNCIYPNEKIVTNEKELIEAVSFDHVCGLFKNYYRSASGFLSSNVIVMDCDNDFTDDETKWITKEKLKDLMPDITFALVPSRHNMKEKDGKKARPKFHVYFEIDEITESEKYAKTKRKIQSKYKFFDENALDSARFIYASNVKDDEVLWNEGSHFITDVLSDITYEDDKTNNYSIPIGMRNKTLSHFAGRILKRYGITDEARKIFDEEALKCDEPISDEELNSIWHSAVKFANKVQSQEGYISPEDYNNDLEKLSLKPDDLSDIGQAMMLAKEYKDKICYSEATDFLVYNGSCWEESSMGAHSLSQELTERQLNEVKREIRMLTDLMKKNSMFETIKQYGMKKAGEMFNDNQIFNDYKNALEYQKYVMKRRDSSYVSSTLKEVKPMVTLDVNELDKDEFLLNTPNATYDLASGNYKKNDSADLITKETLVSPGEEGKDLWLDAINTFFCNDESLIKYVQEIVGLSAIGKIYMESIIIAYGEGRNGKSTFWNSIAKVLGSYSGTLSADALTAGCKRNVKPEMAELKGKRLVIAAELEEGMRLNTSVIKQLSSTDEITAEKKYKAPFKFTPSHTLVLYTNHLPKVGANDEGTWRRLIVIPFNAKIEGKSDIKNYTDYLVKNAGPYIMKWIIEGARRVVENDFKIVMPKCVEDSIKSYKANNDWMGNFLEDCCIVGKDLVQKSGEFYQEYRCYCSRMGEYARSTTDFYTALEFAGFVRKRTNKGSFIYGVKLKDEGIFE